MNKLMYSEKWHKMHIIIIITYHPMTTLPFIPAVVGTDSHHSLPQLGGGDIGGRQPSHHQCPPPSLCHPGGGRGSHCQNDFGHLTCKQVSFVVMLIITATDVSIFTSSTSLISHFNILITCCKFYLVFL